MTVESSILAFSAASFRRCKRLAVVAQVDAAARAGTHPHQVIDDALVEVVAAQVGVSVGGEHFKDTVLEFENGNVEGPATQVVDGDRTLGFFLGSP